MKITNKVLLERMQRLENKAFAESTIQRYLTDVKLFLHRLGTTATTENITLATIEKRKTTLKDTMTPKTSIYYAVRPTLSWGTIYGKLTALKSLLKFLNYYYDSGVDYRKIELKKCKSDYVECITDTEFNLFMNFIGDHEKYKINALRMQLLCNIGYTSGLRLSEMLSLKIEDVQKKETRITGKGNKARWVFFTDSTEQLLQEYLYERKKPIPRTGVTESDSQYVFISHNSGYDFGHPIKRNTVCEKIKKYSDEIGLGKRITVHSLRHSYATKLLENGFNIREIQELLGHCDIQTTEGYCHVLKSNLAKKVNQVFC